MTAVEARMQEFMRRASVHNEPLALTKEDLRQELLKAATDRGRLSSRAKEILGEIDNTPPPPEQRLPGEEVIG